MRPYNDQEVPGVVRRVVGNPEFAQAASRLVMPAFLRGTGFGDWVTSALLRLKTRHLQTVSDCQLFIADYLERLINETTQGLTCSGLESLDRQGVYLFISNHRDILLDSTLLNFLIHKAGHKTCRMAVGDNLLSNELAADLMRLNKSFIVERNVVGAKATLTVLMRTSNYIQHSLDEGASIWIAQREGRAKDGWDRTDPALIKMLALAYKKEPDPIVSFLQRVKLIPVSISYELDPNAQRKAHELSVIDHDGVYDKSADEDLQSMILGLLGQKGRVHLHFGEPIVGAIDTPEALASAVDVSVMRGMRIYPTHVAAAEALGAKLGDEDQADVPELGDVMSAFRAQIGGCPDLERDFLLRQYANVLLNRRALGAREAPGV